MTRSSMTTRVLGIAALIGVALIAGWALADEILSVEIEVAPKVLNLLNNGQVVTVHTDLPYAAVDAWTVSLNGVPISSYKSDNRGNFVAKFPIEEVKGLVDAGDLALGTNTLVLTGFTRDVPPVAFEGTTEVVVVNNGPGR